MNVVESNNDFVNNNAYVQSWSANIFMDELPTLAPATTGASRKRTITNPDSSTCTLFYFTKTTTGEAYEYLCYASNLQLVREFRQSEKWQVSISSETDIRKLIFPGRETYRVFTPVFTDGDYEIPYTTVNPEYNLQDCYLETSKHYDKLFINCWFYVGKKLSDFAVDPPFSDEKYLLKGTNSLAKLKTASGETNEYQLPKAEVTEADVSTDEQMFVTTKNINTVLSAIGNIDEGEYW